MSDFSIKISNRYSVSTYENTKKTYNWIYHALKEAKLLKSPIESDFLFDVGKITCNCKKIQEFSESAYGETDYKLITMKLFQISKFGMDYIFVFVDSDGLRITSSNKSDLEKLIEILDKEPQAELENIKISKIKQWTEAILQNLIANWIWIVLTSVVSFIIGLIVKR